MDYSWDSHTSQSESISNIHTDFQRKQDTVFNLGLQRRELTGPIQPKIGEHLEKEGALT